jgi:hypothetical protein
MTAAIVWASIVAYLLAGLAGKVDNITIQDYDAYNHHELGMTLEDVLNNPDRKMGHGFVLAMMLEEMGL